jgi:DNA-binding protein H-NS
MVSLTSLEQKIAKLQQRADIERRKQSGKVVVQIHDLMARFGLSLTDLGKGPEKGSQKTAVTDVVRRGRPPKAATLNGSADIKHVGFPKGKMPPKYRDPKTGAVWSGHARPPAWIAKVKDRTRFLINPADVAPKPTASKTIGRTSAGLSVTKTATKKTATKSVTTAPAKKAVAKKVVAKKEAAKSLSSTKPAASPKKTTSSGILSAVQKAIAKQASTKKASLKKTMAVEPAAKPADKVAVSSRKAAAKKVTSKVSAPVSVPVAAPAPAAEASV